MFAAFPALIVTLSGQTPQLSRLLTPRWLNPGVTTGRLSPAGGFGTDGALLEMAADTPRHGRAGGLLIEEERSNGIRNPRAAGATPGTPGTTPTNWSLNRVAGLTSGIASSGSEGGLPFLEFSFGSSSGSSNSYICFEAGAVACTAGLPVTLSCFLRLSGGSLANASLLLFLTWRNATGGTISTTQLLVMPTGGSLADQRFAFTATPPAGSVSVLPNLRLSVSGAVNLAFQVAAPQLEQGSFATTPILPPAGAPGAATRRLDEVAWSPTGGLGTAGTVVARASLPRNAVPGQSQGLWQCDNGGSTERIHLAVAEDGALRAVVERAGGTVASLALGTVPDRTAFRVAVAWGGGGISGCLGGGTPQSAAVTLPAAPGRLLLGRTAGAGGAAPLNGELLHLDLHGTRLADAQLQALANEP